MVRKRELAEKDENKRAHLVSTIASSFSQMEDGCDKSKVYVREVFANTVVERMKQLSDTLILFLKISYAVIF